MNREKIRSLIEEIFNKHEYNLGIGLDIFKEKDIIDDLVEIIASNFKLDESE